MTKSGADSLPSIIALHGFLGLPRDWSRIDFSPLRIEAHALWQDVRVLGKRLQDGRGFDEWAGFFNAQIRARNTAGPGAQAHDQAPQRASEPQLSGQLSDKKPVLMGYSLGGRLAMHAAIAAPELYRALIVVSSHPGLSGEAEKEQRREADRIWAGRFSRESWAEVIEAWNSQPVLLSPRVQSHAQAQAQAQAQTLERREEDFSRVVLASALESWSLGHQRDLRGEIARLSIPVLFVSGATDVKFSALMKGLQLGPRQSFVEISGAGHRVPWDQPLAFASAVREFLGL
jgi:2-succinyl-6-hydroxy-2,4-cyclohexadiene-1-carboxylate synthase